MPETISDARAHLTEHVARFREQGIEAEPVVFGDHRSAEAVLLPYATFELLLEMAEDLAIAEMLHDRLAQDSGRRTSLQDAAAEFDIDLDTL